MVRLRVEIRLQRSLAERGVPGCVEVCGETGTGSGEWCGVASCEGRLLVSSLWFYVCYSKAKLLLYTELYSLYHFIPLFRLNYWGNL